MIFVDKEIIEYDNYIEFTSFNKFNLKIYYTKKAYGNILEKKTDMIKRDFKIENKEIISSHQTHSANIKLIKNLEEKYFEDVDGMLTANKNIAILTKYADCFPIFIYNEENGVFGSIHSGWKGTYQEIIKIAIDKISDNKDFSKIHILFGVGISYKNYDVGEEFLENFKNRFDKNIIEKSFFKKDNKIFFDNQLFNYYLLRSYGIPEENIYLNNKCTFIEDFHSYRRDKEKSGRNGAIIFKED